MSFAFTHVTVGVFICASLMAGIFLIDLDHIQSWKGFKECVKSVANNTVPDKNLVQAGIMHSWKFFVVCAGFMLGWSIHLLMDFVSWRGLIAP